VIVECTPADFRIHRLPIPRLVDDTSIVRRIKTHERENAKSYTTELRSEKLIRKQNEPTAVPHTDSTKRHSQIPRIISLKPILPLYSECHSMFTATAEGDEYGLRHCLSPWPVSRHFEICPGEPPAVGSQVVSLLTVPPNSRHAKACLAQQKAVLHHTSSLVV
jgi:hypothetical protein